MSATLEGGQRMNARTDGRADGVTDGRNGRTDWQEHCIDFDVFHIGYNLHFHRS